MKTQGYKDIPRSEYWVIHQWVRRKYGKAFMCDECFSETEKVFDWALKHGKKYERKRANFRMLCKKCHHKYDKISRFGSKHPMFGKHHSEQAKLKMKEARIGRKPMLGKHHSEKTKTEMRENRIGVLKSEEHKRKISEGLKKFHNKIV